MNNSDKNNGSKFMSGLMWGAIIGGGLVFLLGTKKGKKIIKALSEEGLELTELLGGEGDEDEIEEEIIVRPDTRKQAVRKVVPQEKKEQADTIVETETSNHSNEAHNGSTISKITHAPHRFFRRTSKQ